MLIAALALNGCIGFGLYRPAAPGSPEIVEVRLTEFTVDPWPRLVRAGRVLLDVVDDGALAHGLAVVGPGVDLRTDDFLSPGEQQKMSLDLKVGRYRFYCPDGDHAGRGMDAEVVVTESVSWFRR